jgi:type I restriction enzyme S subunit
MTVGRTQLSELFTIHKGHKPGDVFGELVPGARRLLQINDLRGQGPLRYTSDKSGLSVTTEDIVVAWDGANAGTVGFGLEGTAGSTLAVLRPVSDAVFAPYAGRYLQSKFASLSRATDGAAVPHLNRRLLESMVIPLPSLAEQRRIAAVLDKADAVRRKRRESLGLLDEFLRSAFRELFGDLVRNDKKWQVLLLENVAQVQGGLQVSARARQEGRVVPYLRVANVYRDQLDLAEIKTLRASEDEISRTALQVGDVLVVEGHGNREEIGRSAVWSGSIDPCVHQNHIIRVRCEKARVEPVYLSAYLNSAAGRRQMIGFGKTTSGLNTISTGNVKKVKVAIPPLELQRRYTDHTAHVCALAGRIRKAEMDAEALFDSLAQRAFRGEM